MNKIFFANIIFISFLIFFGCDESFNPNKEFEEVYSLNCILNADSLMQVATIKRSFSINGFDPENNGDDPTVKGAIVKLLYEGKTYLLKDSTLAKTDDWKYNTDINFYYTKELRFDPGKKISVAAELPNGTLLTSEVQIPSSFNLYLNTNTAIAEFSKGYFELSWSISDNNLIYFPKFYLNYFVKTADGIIPKQKEIPTTYFEDGNQSFPFYPEITVYNRITYLSSAIEKTIELISEGDADKAKYILKNTSVEVIVMNKELGTYISSIKIFDDGFTVKTQPAAYTNIKGGRGIFGIYYVPSKVIEFGKEYIEKIISKYGYRYNPSGKF